MGRVGFSAALIVLLSSCGGGGGGGSVSPVLDPATDGDPPTSGATEFIFRKYIVKDPQQSAGFIDVKDMDGDGVMDIWLSTLVEVNVGPPNETSRGALRLFTSDTGTLAGPWSENVVIATTDPEGFPFINNPQVYDVDEDGIDDIIVQTGFLTTRGGAHFWQKGPEYTERNYFDLLHTTKNANDMWHYWHESEQLDLDKDGDLDIVTTSAASQSLTNPLGSPNGEERLKVEWYENDGTGSFTWHEIMQGTGGVFMKTYDVDSDGDEDIVLSNFFQQDGLAHVSWLENIEAPSADNSFAGVWQEHSIDNTIGLGYHLIFTDIDQDGKDELLIGNHNNQNDPRHQDDQGNLISPPGIFYFEIPNDPKNVSQWEKVVIDDTLEVTISASNPASQGVPGIFDVGDVNGDGLTDIAVPGDGNNDLYVYLKQSNNTWQRTVIDNGLTFGMAKIADIDGDGTNEIIAANHNATNGGTELPPGFLAIYSYEEIEAEQD